MPLVLSNLDTGVSSPPMTRPKPVVAGKGDDRLAAVLAPVPPGWVVIPVGSVGAVRVNGHAPAGPTALRFGEVLMLGAKRFFIDQCTAPPATEALAAVFGGAEAELTARSRGWDGVISGSGPFVIGTAPDCDLVLPLDSGLDRHHALFAQVVDRWYLFVLGKPGVTSLADPTPKWADPVPPGQSVWLGDVELTAHYDEPDPLDRVYGGLSTPSPIPPPSAETVNEMNRPEGTTPAKALPATPRPARLPSPDAGTITAANALCRRLQDAHARTPRQLDPPLAPGPALPPDPVPVLARPDALAGHEIALAGDPWRPAALFALAEFLWRAGLPENARWVLKQMHHQNPLDPVVNESIGVVCWSQGCDDSRPDGHRADDLDRAARYLSRALAARPGDVRLGELVRAVGAEQARLRAHTAAVR
ncbi:MAG: FHA domain-containing protein [Gemmataceae bacterium]